MRDSYVNNVEEILIANETQKAKIEFLQREKAKRDHYLADLQENLRLNKQTLLEMNSLGPNLTALSQQLRTAQHLEAQLQHYYDDYQSINAVLLMEKQMRLEDKHFYNERIIEFENKIVDLRKYLHDKEDSFSSVVTRLKRYEELSELPLDDKLAHFKKEMGERHLNQFITDLLAERNALQRTAHAARQHLAALAPAKPALLLTHPHLAALLPDHPPALPPPPPNDRPAEDARRKKLEPNRELIRLLKKEKLNNELLEEALNEAIDKNEQLVSIKQSLQHSLALLTAKYGLLHAENTLMAMRLGEYDRHFCRQHLHSPKFYEEGDQRGLAHMLRPRLQEYARHAAVYYEQQQLRSNYAAKLKADVEQWGEFLCESDAIRRETIKRGLLTKSCSEPSLLVGFDLDNDQPEDEERLEIVEF